MAAYYSKNLLGNVIHHTKSHNRRVEENEMWAQRNSEKYDRPRNYYEHGNTASTSTTNKAVTSNKWSIELLKYEESLGNERWGHGGYKELYPDEFDDSHNGTKSTNKRKSYGSDSDSSVHKKAKKKRKTKDKDDTHSSKYKKHKKRKKSKRDKKKKGKHRL